VYRGRQPVERAEGVSADIYTAILAHDGTLPSAADHFTGRIHNRVTASAQPAIRSSGRMKNILAGCVRRSWNAPATEARICDASGRDKRSIIVHHRVAGKSGLNLMISLCPGCHSKVHRTKMIISKKPVPPLLLALWREQHPNGQEQSFLDFKPDGETYEPVRLFVDEGARMPSQVRH
jgi:hypothetical protein